MVSYVDGSVLAQLGSPDMRTPISFTLGWPSRIVTPSQRLDLAAIGQLTFEEPDPERFPCLRLARDALQTGGSAPTLLNAANEVAVEAFLAGRIGFLDIAGVVEDVLNVGEFKALTTLNDVHDVDQEGRRLAKTACERMSRTDRVA
jgi:1-deoxy-D-xylulose-5-phosphate reductoisomerase